jgi:hypothetical protein
MNEYFYNYETGEPGFMIYVMVNVCDRMATDFHKKKQQLSGNRMICRPSPHITLFQANLNMKPNITREFYEDLPETFVRSFRDTLIEHAKYSLFDSQTSDSYFVKEYRIMDRKPITDFWQSIYKKMDLCDGVVKGNHTVYSQQGIETMATNDHYSDPDKWKPHITIINTCHVKSDLIDSIDQLNRLIDGMQGTDHSIDSISVPDIESLTVTVVNGTYGVGSMIFNETYKIE